MVRCDSLDESGGVRKIDSFCIINYWESAFIL